jgi:hypothetical protein
MKHLARHSTAALAATLALATAGLAQAQTQADPHRTCDVAGPGAADCRRHRGRLPAAGYNVTAAVVDRAGQLRALQRADGAGPHTLGRRRPRPLPRPRRATTRWP